MATTITKEFRFDSSNATTYAEAGMNVLGRDSNFIYVYLNNDKAEDVYLKQSGKDQLFPSATAKPYRLDNSMRYRRTVGGTAQFYFYIDDTEIHHTSSSSNSYTTNDKTNITSSVVTNCTSSSEFRWYVGNTSTVRGAALLWAKLIFYFYQYACVASAGEGVATASVSNSTPYSGDTVTFSCTMQPGYTFDGWYNGSTRVSTSISYTVNAADISLTAKGTPSPCNMFVKINGQWQRGTAIWQKQNGIWVQLQAAPSEIQDGQKCIHIDNT